MRIYMILNRLAAPHLCQPLAEAGQAVSRFFSVGKKEKGPRGADLFCFSSYIQNSSFGELKFGKVVVEVAWNQQLNFGKA
jgi:hypothetical protein